MLAAAGVMAGIDTAEAKLIRDGTNAIYELADVVARIGRVGGERGARTSVTAARWLAASDVPVVRPLTTVEQPMLVDGRPVTWWRRLPQHRHATPAELGAILRELHALPQPASAWVPELDPLEGIEARICAAHVSRDDHRWLHEHAAELLAQYTDLPSGLPPRVIHGDAWQGNVVVPDGGGPTLLDLDHVSFGPPEWDLVPLAVDHTDFARISMEDYQGFVNAYGHDVTRWAGYDTLAAIRELRWTAFALSKAGTGGAAAREAEHRIACLRGRIPRPWTWSAF